MEEQKKPKYYIFFRVLFALFVLFLCLYSISVNGFIERKNYDKALYTEEQIEQFEYDVSNGKDVDIEFYLDNSKPDYENVVSGLGEDISNLISYGAEKSMELLERFFEFLFE